MSDRKLIGRVSATEKYPSSCDDFQFWLSDDAILSPFDIVRVENKTDDSITYGVVQDILHITDGTGHLSNYVSSDFGNVDTTPMTRRLSLSYAKVSVIHNTKENFMPVFEGSPVYTADNVDIEIALGLDNIDEKTAIPAGLMKASNNVAVPIKYNGDFLIGPEGAHMNISGISGLATKTSYVMFLLKAIQHKYKDDVAIIVMNVKGDDLLHVHQPNEKITPVQREEWDTLGVPCEPFENVKYLYPFRKQKDKLYANTALPMEDLAEQYSEKRASNFIYTFEHDISSYDYFIDHDGNVFGDMIEFDGTHGLSAYNKTDQEKYEGSDSTFISPKYVQTIESKPVSEWIIAVGRHEGFIPSEQWIEVQELLDAIAEKYNRPHRKTNALLAGLAHCPHCGRRLSVISESDRWTNGKPRFKYVCPGYRKKECNFKAVDGVLLDEFVVQQLSELSDENSERFRRILEIKIEEVLEQSQTVQEHNIIKKKRDKLKADIAAQTRNLREADGSIKQFIQEDLQNLAEELRETERQLSKLDEGRKNNMIAIRDLEMTKERLLSFAEYAKDAQ